MHVQINKVLCHLTATSESAGQLSVLLESAGVLLQSQAAIIEIRWDMGYDYDKPFNVKCGDSLRFTWANGVHGVRLMAPGEPL